MNINQIKISEDLTACDLIPDCSLCPDRGICIEAHFEENNAGFNNSNFCPDALCDSLVETGLKGAELSVGSDSQSGATVFTRKEALLPAFGGHHSGQV